MHLILNVFNNCTYSFSLRSWPVECYSPHKVPQRRSKFNAKAAKVDGVSCSKESA